MGNVFIGFILVFLDFNLDIGSSRIGLIPDFIGYIYILKGLEELDGESTFFMKVKPFVTGMAVYSGILYIMDLFGISVSLGLFTYVLAFVSIAISLYISYNIVMGVIDMEGKYNTTLNGERLKSTWTLLAVFNILTIVSLLTPLLTIIGIILSFIATIIFLVDFNNSKKLYYNTVIK
ncbi:MAG: hypothetical protein PHC56_12135 [Herbinix sp.]|nr:hypothetical protein [Herbinix sp.]